MVQNALSVDESMVSIGQPSRLNAKDGERPVSRLGATDDSRRLPARLTVSLKTLALMVDAHRSSVRRWLQEAGVKPVVLGRGRNGAIRYLWRDVERWLESLQQVD
jgi:hypothetical protein